MKYNKYRMRLIISGILTALVLSWGSYAVVKENKQKKIRANASALSELAHEDIFDAYDEYVELIAKGIKDVDMHNDVIDVFALYTLLEESGLISFGTFEYADPEFEPLGGSGVAIALGNGVCRNQSANLCNIFEALDYECGLVVGEYCESKATGKSNHQIVYVKDDDKIYYLDPTNKTIFLRNIVGKYISMKNEDVYFIPKVRDNELYGTVNDDYSIYFDIAEEYSNLSLYNHRYNEALEKAKGHLKFFKDYERDELIGVEIELKELVDEYFDLINKIKQDLEKEKLTLNLKNE